MSDHSADLAMLASRGFPAQSLDAGEKLFLEQDLGSCLYVVRSGAIEIITYGAQLERVEAGGIFGEVALIDDGPRSASAMAMTNSEVIRIDRPAFLDLVRDHPDFALQVMRSMAARLRRTTSG